MSRVFLLCIGILLSWNSCFAQGGPGKGRKGNAIFGQVIDAISGKPLEYATVSVFNAADNKLLTGQITDLEGKYRVEVPARKINVRVEFLGYKALEVKDIELSSDKDLGVMKVQPDQELLDEVEIKAEKSHTVFKLDKRVFNVGKDLSTAGGSALDILTNVPSVEVSIEGTVSLRGNSNVKILMNGKPSVLTSEGNALGSISSDMIERVEVITNPSAKYDAEGTTGIINIVLKKSEKRGVNGSVTLNVGSPNNHSLGFSMSKRTEKFNLFSQMGAGYRSMLSSSYVERINKTMENPITMISNGDGTKNEKFLNLTLGADYFLTPQDVITLSGHYGYEWEDQDSDTEYEDIDSEANRLSHSNRIETTTATNPKYQYDLQYKKSFKGNKDRSFLISSTGSFFGKDKESEFVNNDLIAMMQQKRQQTLNDFSEAEYSFQSDYVHPFSKEHKLEVGAKYDFNILKNDYQVLNFSNNEWVNDANYSNYFEYKQGVASLYGVYSMEMDRFGFMAGLRTEHTDRNTYLRAEDKENNKGYTDFFPTFHTSYKLTETTSLQFGYSKRIFRPHMWDLNPFTTITDDRNLHKGNPNLVPEYSNSLELTVIQHMKKGNLNGAIFYRNTDNVIVDVLSIDGDVSTTTPLNIGKSTAFGAELNGKYEAFKFLSFMLDLNYSLYDRTGEFDGNSFDFQSDSWSGRLTSKLKLPYDFDMEVKGRYYSAYKDVQGTYDPGYTVDFGLKKKFMKGRTVINLSVRDLFDSRKRASETNLPNYYQYSERRRGGRVIVLGVSYGFGKGDAMEFSGHKMF